MTDSTSTATPAQSTPSPAATRCRNCSTELLGPHCYACGQPVEGLVRPLGSLLGDVLDSVFDFDARIPRTLLPLFTKPGFLTTEYFAGRQVRYVTPVRLFFFLAIISTLMVPVHTATAFSSPFVAEAPGPDEYFQLGGLVKEGSITATDGVAFDFVITDNVAEVPVSYVGRDPAPDLFSEGQGTIAKGNYRDGRFEAGQLGAIDEGQALDPVA